MSFKQDRNPLRLADYLLAHSKAADGKALNALLDRCKSAWTVGVRAAGKNGLLRRVPLGVQVAADDVMSRSARAGVRLARAWELVYGFDPQPSHVYQLAVQAVEDAVVPVVSPNDEGATLGKVIAQMRNQKDWRLPMLREHTHAPSSEVLICMMRVLWHGQHTRHGGQPSSPGDVSLQEATTAVSLAVSIINLFGAGLVARQADSTEPKDEDVSEGSV